MKNEGNKEMFYYKNQRLTKDIRKPFLFQLYYFTSPSHGAVYEDST